MTQRQSGAALLTAMLTVALVASLATAGLWQQWRGVEVEAAERARTQSLWVLTGALDWARLILREDARSGSGGEDHLGEPWAVPLEEARLSSFLAVDKNNTPDESDSSNQAFLSGSISDMQARMNVFNLVKDGQVSPVWLLNFGKLFEQLGLPPSELTALAENLRFARDNTAANAWASRTPLLPQRVGQLQWLGLSSRSLALLDPFITVLPEATKVNLNTASATVLYATIPKLDMAQAQRLVSSRQVGHFRSFDDVGKLVSGGAELTEADHSLKSNFFEVRGRLRLGSTVVEERSLVKRVGMDMKTQWRDRGALPAQPARLQ